jgi:hypothetical protein
MARMQDEGSSHNFREEEEAARRSLTAFVEDETQSWSRQLQKAYQLLEAGWGRSARRFEKGMEGVVLRDSAGTDITRSFIDYLFFFDFDDEVEEKPDPIDPTKTIRAKTGRKQDKAVTKMLDVHGMMIGRVDPGLIINARALHADRVLLLQVQKQKENPKRPANPVVL